MRPLSILRVADIADNRTGGMSRYIHLVSDELRSGGHHVDHLFADGLCLTERGRARRFVTPFRVVQAVLGRAAEGRRYDVVEVHEPIAAAYAAARPWSNRLPPLLVTVYALEARAHRARLEYLRVTNRRPTWRDRLAPLTVVWQANFALGRADHVCVETSSDANYLNRRLGVPAHRITLQCGGVAPDFFAPPGAASRSGILFVGSWLERKGVRDLAQALTQVLGHRPEIGVTLAGTGVAAESVLADFPPPLRPYISVIPAATEKELVALYAGHDIFAFPSVFEGLPLVLLEAAAGGLAVVTTGVCGMADVIRDGENGLVVPVGDPTALAAALLRLAGDAPLRSRLGAAAAATARRYTWRASADQFLAAARACLGRRWGS